MDWEDKKAILEALRPVHQVVPAPEFSPLKILKALCIDIYVVADEWLSTKTEEIAYMKRTGGRVVIAPRFTTFSTTEIKNRLLAEHLKGKELCA